MSVCSGTKPVFFYLAGRGTAVSVVEVTVVAALLWKDVVITTDDEATVVSKGGCASDANTGEVGSKGNV